MDVRQNLLWIDGTAGLAVGATVLLLSNWLIDWYGLPMILLLFIGGVNMLYGTFSLSLARRKERPTGFIKLLVFANLAWVPVCLYLAVSYFNTATLFGLGHIIGEGLFVGLLAVFEWRWREELQTR